MGKRVPRKETSSQRMTSLPDSLYNKAKVIGGGNASSGIRKALEQYDVERALREFDEDVAHRRKQLEEL